MTSDSPILLSKKADARSALKKALKFATDNKVRYEAQVLPAKVEDLINAERPIARTEGGKGVHEPGASYESAGAPPLEQKPTPRPGDYFTLGSTKEEVLAVQGTPTAIDHYGALDEDVWHYGLMCSVEFGADKVQAYTNDCASGSGDKPKRSAAATTPEAKRGEGERLAWRRLSDFDYGGDRCNNSGHDLENRLSRFRRLEFLEISHSDGLLRLSGGFLGLATAVGTLLLGLVMGMGLFVEMAAFPAEEEQNLLRVATHIDSLRRQSRVVKMPYPFSRHG